MRKLFLFFLLICSSTQVVKAQQVTTTIRKRQLSENIDVRDSAGASVPYVVWKNLLSSGNYKLKAMNPKSDSSAFVLVKFEGVEKDRLIRVLPKPAESSFFKDGDKISSFSARDINGNKIKLSELAGKVVVLNFWFIGCPPCRREIPELNKIALKYANNPDVVFVAVALDYKSDIIQFIKDNPFKYHIIEDGKMYADLYRINLFPTNVIVDKEGKVRFHASGYAMNTPYWIDKTIEGLK